ncbi:FAD-dependent monooxygenase [Halocatena marina]|uniref:FAD-dependent monooxygenase n=1 Tax=Halocatena marina TaxID=2934937 RepID=UPI00200D7B43|nr:FAD-dependent monooxygenase [Halocatena marina]
MGNGATEETQQTEGSVIICGAGIAGLTLAWWMDRIGWDVLVLEIASGLRDEGYMIDFLSSGYDVAERMDLIHRLEEVQQPVSEVVNVNENGERVSEMDYELFRQLQNGRLLALMRGDLERELHAALSDDVEIRYGLTVDEVQQDEQAVDVTLSDGTRESVELLVGADGIHSRVRELVFGDESQYLRYLKYHTGAFIFEDESIRRKLDGQFQNLTVPNRTIGCYPLQDGTLATFFVHRTPNAERPPSPYETLKQRYGDLDWIVPELLEHCTDVDSIYYDQVAQIELPRWSKGRVTLVGDACQAVSLLAGQGASLAMGGAYVLAQKLRDDGPIEERLNRYESHMKPEIQEKQAAGRRAAKWLFPPSQWHITVRDTALKVARYPGGSHLLKPVLKMGTESVVNGI